MSCALDLVDERAAPADLASEAFALARRHDALLATMDAKLIRIARKAGVRVAPASTRRRR